LPLVSVLLPVRDGARTLAAALRSVLRQSHRELELVVVDDGSLDGSAELVRAFAARDPRVRLVSQRRLGLCAALNRGLAECRGELIARMDADDLCGRERLRAQVSLLASDARLGAVGCRFRLVPRTGLTDGMLRYERWSNSLVTPEELRRDLLVEAPLCHPSVVLRAAAVREVGGYCDDACGWPEDHDLWLRLDAAGWRLGKVPEVLLLWREGERRLSRAGAAYRPERFFALRLHHVVARAERERRRLLVWGAGLEGKPWLRALRGLTDPGRKLLEDRVIDLDPRKLGQRIHGCLVVRPEELGDRDPSRLVVVAVGAKGAREEIRARLTARGYFETVDYVCVA